MYKNYLKPLLDILLALVLLLLFLPLFLLIALVLLYINQGSPFFSQQRPGKHEKIFTILKFKTMTDKTDAYGTLLPDKDRLTTFGKILRKTSLDELPQLINVLKGDMSFIGPRPLLIRYLPYYTKKEQLRHTVKPGLTGLAQVSGRNFLKWDERLQKDIDYVEHLSLCLDATIFFKTIKKVLLRKDVAEDANLVIKDLDAIRKQD